MLQRLAIVATLAACTSQGRIVLDGSCPIGAETCPCTLGGGCDPGLGCDAGTCVDPGTPDDTGTDTGDTGDADTDTGDTGTDTGDTGDTGTPDDLTWELPPGFWDVVADPARSRIYASYRGDGIVIALDLATDAQTTITTGHIAEDLFYDAAKDEVIVALPTADHSPYWWDDEQEGYVGLISARPPYRMATHWIPLDPYSVAATGDGYVYIAGGSGQWTRMLALDPRTGWTEPNTGSSVRNRTVIAPHPNGDRLYGADNGLSPSDVERYDPDGAGKVRLSYDSPYHGDYAMCGDLRLHPGGDTLFTRCGNVLRTTNTRTTDMTWTATLGRTWADLVFQPDGSRAVLFEAGRKQLLIYDAVRLVPLNTVTVEHSPRRLLATDTALIVITDLDGGRPATQVRAIPWSSL